MAEESATTDGTAPQGTVETAMPKLIASLLAMPGTGSEQLLALLPAALPITEPEDAAHWAEVAARMQAMWLDFEAEQAMKVTSEKNPWINPAHWLSLLDGWYRQTPLAHVDTQKHLWEEGVALWEGILGQYGLGPKAGTGGPEGPALPRSDRRFADPKWREQPFYALVHQTYLLLAEQVTAIADAVEGVDPARKEQLRFATRLLLDACSPDHFPLTNPLVMERARETRGDSLVKGFAHLINDLRKGQLTHTDDNAFRLGENMANTPGKVIYRSRLFEIIQYAPTTPEVLAAPLLIFPPWINRFYILDLNPKKSFVAWAVEQGITVCMVSWKSADASMADVVWDDYIRAQIEAIDVPTTRVEVPASSSEALVRDSRPKDSGIHNEEKPSDSMSRPTWPASEGGDASWAKLQSPTDPRRPASASSSSLMVNLLGCCRSYGWRWPSRPRVGRARLEGWISI